VGGAGSDGSEGGTAINQYAVESSDVAIGFLVIISRNCLGSALLFG
jgi:hypothetical protein